MKTPKQLSKDATEMTTDGIHPDSRIYRKCPYLQSSLLKWKSVSPENLSDNETENSEEYLILEDWIDAQDVMHYLHISPRTLQTLRTNGTLPFSRIGNKIYYLRQDVERILRDNYTMYKIRNYGTDK